MNILPVVINLDRRQDRYKRFCDTVPLPHVRFSAQDGIGTLASGWDRALINLLQAHAANPANLLPGIYGCWQSHYRLWERLSQDWNHDAYLIMEDDITVGEDVGKCFGRMSQNITTQFDIYYLGGAIEENYVPPHVDTYWERVPVGELEVHRMHDRSWQGRPFGRGLYAYVVTRLGACRLLETVAVSAAATSSGFPAVDEWVNRNREPLRVCDVFPHRVWVENTGKIRPHDSDINPRHRANGSGK